MTDITRIAQISSGFFFFFVFFLLCQNLQKRCKSTKFQRKYKYATFCSCVKNCMNFSTETILKQKYMNPVKRICVFEHSVMAILTAHAQPFGGARDLAFCLKVPLDTLPVWASSEGSSETARMCRLAWTLAAHIGNKYQIRLTRSIWYSHKFQTWLKEYVRIIDNVTHVMRKHAFAICKQ